MAGEGAASCGKDSGKAAGLSGKKFPQEVFITQATSRGKVILDKPKAFPMFVRLWGSKTEEDAAVGLPSDSP